MKLFVWDFHGTLEKGNDDAVLEISNIVLDKHGYKERFSELQCRELSGKRWYEYFECLLPEEPKIKYLELQKDCVSFSLSHPEIVMSRIILVDHALEVLEHIKRRHDQILVSNTNPKSLKMYLKSVGLNHIFPKGKAYATNSHAKNKTKKVVLEKYLKVNSFEEIVVIGDSPGDIELGLEVGAKTFLYSHPGHEFKNCEAHFRINDLREVLKFV